MDERKVINQEHGQSKSNSNISSTIESQHAASHDAKSFTSKESVHTSEKETEVPLPVPAVAHSSEALSEQIAEVGKKGMVATLKESFQVLKNPQFMSLTLAEFTASIGYLIPYYYMQTYAVFIGLTPEQGALILGLTNGAAFAGRILLGLLADHFSNSAVMLFSTWATAFAVIIFWSIAKSFATLTLMGVTFGFFVGAYVSLVPVAIAESFGTQTMASMIGLMYGAGGLAMWGGSPLAGAILESTKPNLSYVPVIITTGVSLLLGALCITSWWFFHRRELKREKAAVAEAMMPPQMS
ncbi:hypothetical protein BGZ94_001446 [Podila epigama]|nr:hypothetical protein BGZ94_001446 [Podila epigama]